jgi:hypothetical protein
MHGPTKVTTVVYQWIRYAADEKISIEPRMYRDAYAFFLGPSSSAF